MKILETKRTILREITDADFEALRPVLQAHLEEPVEDNYVHRWLNWCKDCYQKYGFGLWAVDLKETGQMIGSCGVSMQEIDNEQKPEIGYHLRKEYHRQGLGKEISQAIRDYYFTHFDGDEIYSYMNVDNVASYKTAEANGMTYLHLYTTRYGEVTRVYRITRKEWEKIIKEKEK